MDPLNLSAGQCKALAIFASTEDSRPVLHNVHVRPDGAVEAADGHRMLKLSIGAEPGRAVFVPREHLRAVKPGRSLLLDRETGGIEIHNGKLEATLPPATLDGSFPDTDQVVPKYDKTDAICFRADLLKGLAEAAAALSGDKECFIRFTFGKREDGSIEAERAAMIEFRGVEGAEALLMPGRMF